MAMTKITNGNNTIDFYGWQEPFEMSVRLVEHFKIVQWIDNNIKNSGTNVYVEWGYPSIYRFRKAKDKAWFLLNWQ